MNYSPIHDNNDTINGNFNPIHSIKKLKGDIRSQTALILEVQEDGHSEYKLLSLRELYSTIIDHILLFENTYSTQFKKSLSPGAGRLLYRDLRRLEFQFNPLGQPAILIRQHIVLISFDPFRCVVTADRLYLIIHDGMDCAIQILNKFIECNDNDDDLRFEYRAYEAIFTSAITLQNEEYEILNNQTSIILNEFKKVSIISIEKQELFRSIKNKISNMSSKIIGYKRIISELLEEDADMALMNLTYLRNKPSLYNLPLNDEVLTLHSEIEVLLEAYIMDYNNLESKIEFLRSQIFSVEELVLLRLDTSRNQLLIADIILSLSGFVLGCGNLIGAIFGMNLVNHLENNPNTFVIVIVITILLMLGVFVGFIGYFRYSGVFPKELAINNSKSFL